ncbi:MAG: heme NO-binding domain-containing protein [Saprospiraceae bacterium]|nr:heme NO-binding domain-containing protein [Saprospiraceae bacterium]
MKGIVFTEFLDLVEEKFGLMTLDEIIEKSDLPSGGSYTAVGTYEFQEMLQLVTNLSAVTGVSVDDLLMTYGEHFFKVLEKSYPHFLEQYQDPLGLLSSIESHIHVEVRKIYPDAELPKFEVLDLTESTLVMMYRSSRALYKFGLGLMHSTFAYFGEKAEIEAEKIEEDGSVVKFSIHKI